MYIPKNKDDRLSYMQGLYDKAQSTSAKWQELLQRHKAQYDGDDTIDGSAEKATVVRNITYEIIESQIDTNIPMPKVTPEVESEGTSRCADAVERTVRQLRDKLDFEELNDIDERRTYIFGGSVWLVEWDNSIVTRDTVGDVKITLVSPQDFFPQPGVNDIDEMDYLFIRYRTTKDELVRRFNVQDTDAADREIDDEISSDEDDIVSVIICYYKGADDDICRYTWSGDLMLEDISDYYARKVKVCRVCGKRQEICLCDRPLLESVSDEYEELDADIICDGGHKIIPAMSPLVRDDLNMRMRKVKSAAVDAEGNPIIDANGEIALTETDEPIMRATRIKYYKPKHFPVVVRKNITSENSVVGQSDCGAIRQQQQAINKVESRIMQKLMRAGITPVIPEDAQISVTNQVFGQVIKMRPGESKSDYGTIDSTPNIQQDIIEAERIYDQAKRIVGITDSYQGQSDTTAKSGRAKQVQVAQAAGRLQSKRVLKNASYARIDRIIFEYYLAYADEPRTVTWRDPLDGKIHDNKFNRYDFCTLDEDRCEYYYDDRYTFATDKSTLSNADRQEMWDTAFTAWQAGAYGQGVDALIMLWSKLDQYRYPDAHTNAEYFRALKKNMEATNAIQGLA